MTNITSIWKGVYASFDEARAHYPDETNCDAFISSRWLGNCASRMESAQSELAEGEFVASVSIPDQGPLPVICGALLAKKPMVKILDFGGGVGSGILSVLTSLPDNAKVDVVIVDNPEICRLGRGFFSDDPRVSFSDTLPPTTESFDIVHCSSSLQYIDEWEELLGKLTGYGAEYMSICDLPAGDIPTFITLQKYYGHLIPVRFWNINEFLSVMETLEHRLIYKTAFIATFLGKRGPMPMEELPLENRLKHACHLLFTRKESA